MAFLPLALQHDWGSPGAKSRIKQRRELFGVETVHRAKYVTALVEVRGVVTSKTLTMTELTHVDGEAVAAVATERVSVDIIHSPSPSKATRPLGMLRGKFAVPADFNAPLPADIQRFFEGERE